MGDATRKDASTISPGGPASERRRLVLAAALPLVAFAIQFTLWKYITPFAWFLFFPTVFFSSWLAGLRGAIPATILSIALAWYFFIPPERSFQLTNLAQLGSILIFLLMGILFGYSHERIRRANADAFAALASAKAANDELKGANAKVTELYERTKELDRLKTRLFSNISHELRTPLTLILGPVESLLAAGAPAEGERTALETIRRSARLLYRHISDLLDVSKLDAGRMSLRWARLDLAALARFTASYFVSAASERGIALEVEAPEAFPAQGDREKLERVLVNLLSNAFKFSPPGGRIALSLAARDGRAIFTVSDEGPGVPAELREEIFERFFQAEGGSERRYGGTGLGLSIAKEFVELHGGSILCASGGIAGATFIVELPTRAPAGAEVSEDSEAHAASDGILESQAAEEARRASGAGGPGGELGALGAPLVLVVEDNADMGAFLSQTLGGIYRVALARDGEEGLELALKLRPDLILTDVMMPRMDGERLVAALRGRAELDSTPILVLSARADEESRISFLRNGAQDYMSKPFSSAELAARASRLLAESRRAGDRLRESEGLLRAIIDNANAMVWVKDAEGRFLIVNEFALAALGRKAEEMIGRGALEVFHDEYAERDEADDGLVLRDRIAGEFEEEARLADGVHDYLSIKFPILDAAGGLRGIGAIRTDVTRLKVAEAEVRELNEGLERRVEERTEELRDANRQLESYGHAISHDLRAPLRAIGAFVAILHEDHADRLDDAARVVLGRIETASERMGRLIDGLLTLSRSRRDSMRDVEVDLSALAEGILGEFAAAEPGRKVSWELEPGLSVRGDDRMIESLLRNLLDNAWKYTGKREEALIKLASSEAGGRRLFCVSDNGAGFDPEYAGKLFQPFQRLHGEAEFPGIGIGLATAMSIARRHGGDMFARSEPGRGASFYFSLEKPGPS